MQPAAVAPAPAQQKKKDKSTKAAQQNFNGWCENELRNVTTCDVQTLLSFLEALDNPKDVCDYVSEYLGKSKEVDAKKFAEQYIQRRNQDGTLRGSFSPDMWRSGSVEAKKVGRLLLLLEWCGWCQTKTDRFSFVHS